MILLLLHEILLGWVKLGKLKPKQMAVYKEGYF